MTPDLTSPSLHGRLLRATEAFPDRLAISDATGDLTYAELWTKVSRAAGGLQRLGLTAGEPVIVCLPNAADFVVAHFGVLAAGGLSVPCEHRAPAPVLADVAARTEARFAILPWPGVVDLLAVAPHLTCLYAGARGEDAIAAPISFDDLCASSDPVVEVSPRSGADTATLMFTSGSTGRSKGVVLAHAATLFTIDNLISRLGYGPAERELITLPVSHSFGLGHVYCNLFSGGAVRLEQGLLNLKRVFSGLTEFAATGFPGTPLGFGMLIDRTGPLLAQAGAALRFIVINSAPLPPERTAQLQALLPRTEIFFYYGLTEASRSTLISLTHAPVELHHSVGQAMPGVEISLAPQTAEVVIRGPHLAAGYWRDPELTAQTMGDGWLRTGDVGRFDNQSNLFIVGRLKELINVGGHKVDPSEVDAVIMASGLVGDVATCGIPGPAGELVACAVVSESDIDEALLTEYCAARLEGYKIPTRWFRMAEIPRTDTGKARRQELATSLAETMKAAP